MLVGVLPWLCLNWGQLSRTVNRYKGAGLFESFKFAFYFLCIFKATDLYFSNDSI
jgi:hypothetical protein